MDALEAIMNRRSIRTYTDQPVTDEQIETLLRAAMAAPTSVNNLDWQFAVIRRKEHMEKIMELKPGNADMLREASAAILVCGDMQLAYPGNPDYWIQDCAAATQNILIAATALGLGSVWLGVYPNTKRAEALRQYFALPEHLTPFGIVSLGYPAEQKSPRHYYDPAKVHYL